MAKPLDVATANWCKAKTAFEKAQKVVKDNPHSNWHKQRLKLAEQEFNLACIDRQKAREKPEPIDWESMNVSAES